MEDTNQVKNLVRQLNFKVIFVGLPRVGITSIINRGVNNQFEDTTTPTRRVRESRYKYQTESENIILEILNTPGENKPMAYMPNYFSNVDAIVMVYDQTNLESFNFILKTMDELRRLCDKPLSKIALFIVGNKSDLPIDQLQVYHKDAEAFCKRSNATFIQMSKKSKSNINFLFESIVEKVNDNFKNSNKPSEATGNSGCMFL